MKYLSLKCIVLGFLLLGCYQTKSKNNLKTEVKSTATVNDRTISQDNHSDNEQLEKYKIDSIKNVIALFKEKNIDKISSKIKYPLNREYPIPPIKNRDEFKKRFNQVFDKILIDKIVNSSINKWLEVGWRGIMLDEGLVWMANSDGIITAVNYQSEFEKQLRKDLLTEEKEKLHISLNNFARSIYKIKTKNYLIRIDELTNHKYRYASWKINKQESSKPDLILENGEFEYQGSGGNHVISFSNNTYTYKIYRNILGVGDSPDITLEVEKGGQIILTQDGTLDK